MITVEQQRPYAKRLVYTIASQSATKAGWSLAATLGLFALSDGGNLAEAVYSGWFIGGFLGGILGLKEGEQIAKRVYGFEIF